MHVVDEINCSDVANYLKFLLKKVSIEKNKNSAKFFYFLIFFPKIFFFAVGRHMAGHMPANILRFFKNVCRLYGRHMAGHMPANFFWEKKIYTSRKFQKVKNTFLFEKNQSFFLIEV